VGIGRTTIERAEQVVRAAEEDPEIFGYLAEQMDRSAPQGNGRVAAGETEQYLLAARGRLVFRFGQPDHRAACQAVRLHSRKPNVFFELVEELCPGSEVELFARQQREG
jgi:N6-adenosine-specific RNA methylase IME4